MQNLDDAILKIRKFSEDRNWNNPPGDLAKSIMIESAELLEHFQWDDSSSKTLEEKVKSKNIDEISAEVADIFWYLLLFCNSLEIDLLESINKKYIHNAKKFPLDKVLKGGKKFYKDQKQKYRSKINE